MSIFFSLMFDFSSSTKPSIVKPLKLAQYKDPIKRWELERSLSRTSVAWRWTKRVSWKEFLSFFLKGTHESDFPYVFLILSH